MRIQQLEYFIAIYKHGSFSAAADEMYISQSSISKSVISLEEELGIKLFQRDTRHVTLSPAGEKLLPYFEHMVDEYSMMKRIKQAKQSFELIRIGGVPVLSIYGITAQLLNFENAYHKYNIEISEIKTNEILNGIDDRTLDIGIVRLHLPIQSSTRRYKVFPLIDDRQVVVLPKGTAFSGRERIDLSELGDIPFVQINTDPLISAYHIEQIKQSIDNAIITLMNSKMDSIKQYILQKQCASLMMNRVAQSMSKSDTDIFELNEQTSLTLCAVVRSGSVSNGVGALVSFLRLKFAGLSEFQ